MAKITIEDCLEVIENRFELTLVAANRARELTKGHTPIVPVKAGEKTTVTALREIASGKFSKEKLQQLRFVRR